MKFFCVALFIALAAGCNCGGPPSPDGGTGGGSGGGGGGLPDAGPAYLCTVDIERFTVRQPGSSRGTQVTSPSQLIGGPTAWGKTGDWLLENDRVRFIVQGVDRHLGPQPFGGTLLDADLRRDGGPGQDQFGEMGLLYSFGRTLFPEHFDLLLAGGDGEPTVLAVSGPDIANDYLSLRNQLTRSFGNPPAADPYAPVPLHGTTYYVLNPGESRVRMVTALCNDSTTETIAVPVGDLTDPGYTLEFFNPQGCTGGFGYGGICSGLDRMSWYGFQGDGVAYGYAPYKVGAPGIPEKTNAQLTVAGISGTLIGAPGLGGLLDWFDLKKTSRTGQMTLVPGGNKAFSRDFFVGADLGEVSNAIEKARAASLATELSEINVRVTVQGSPIANARVAFESLDGNVSFTTGADGRIKAALPVRPWTVSAWAQGHLPSSKQTVTSSASTPASLEFTLPPSHRLTVTAKQAGGGPLPAKVTVSCSTSPCPAPNTKLVLYTDSPKDPRPDGVEAVNFIPASGTVSFELPAGQYTVLVSRGPEYSIFPNTFPATPGVAVDLRTADATVNATLARVVDTTGYMSGDFHVHAVNSVDSTVDNAQRALGFAADGVDILVSTDHDYVTDYAPVIVATNLSPFLVSVAGEEASSMDWGHYNLFPLTPASGDPINGGAIDWAVDDGPTMSPSVLFAEARKRGVKTIQFNHARGDQGGGLTSLRADTDTFASHAPPELFRMATVAGATPSNTRLLSEDFNAFEVLNSSEDFANPKAPVAVARFNDWFTLLSRGVKVAGTGVSDTHERSMSSGWRTWVATGVDTPAAFQPAMLSTHLNALEAIASNGPFVKLTAYRVDGAGAAVTPPIGPGGTVVKDSRELGVTVDIQVPEYLDLTRVELYLHKAQDDASCPYNPQSPIAATTRVACDGVSNSNWPASGISASQTISLTNADKEIVGVVDGVTYRRYRKVVNFKLPAPTTDNWVVAFVYGSKSLFPILFTSVDGSLNPTYPFAITNPVFIDADGNGYDKPPFKATLPQPGPPGPMKEGPASVEEMIRRWGNYAMAR